MKMLWSNFCGGFFGAAIGVFIPMLLLATMDEELHEKLRKFAIRGMKERKK